MSNVMDYEKLYKALKKQIIKISCDCPSAILDFDDALKIEGKCTGNGDSDEECEKCYIAVFEVWENEINRGIRLNYDKMKEEAKK